MTNQTSGRTGVAKAGKRSHYQEPPAPNPDKQAAREQGYSQFTAKEFPAPLPAVKGSWDCAMDVLCRAFRVKRIRYQSHDIGVRYDPHRKQFLHPPNRRNDG